MQSIYKITNRVTGKFYIGSARRTQQRWNSHRSQLNLNKHSNLHLQRAWNKYGGAAFDFEVIENCDGLSNAELLAREQLWLNETGCCNSDIGYNMSPIAGAAMAGRRHSEQARLKMAQSRTGHTFSTESRERMSEARRGRALSQVTRDKIAAKARGRKASVATRQKMSAARKGRPSNRRGIAMTEAQKLKISEALRGNQNSLGCKHPARQPRPMTDAHRRNISRALLGNTRRRDYSMKQRAESR